MHFDLCLRFGPLLINRAEHPSSFYIFFDPPMGLADGKKKSKIFQGADIVVHMSKIGLILRVFEKFIIMKVEIFQKNFNTKSHL